MPRTLRHRYCRSLACCVVPKLDRNTDNNSGSADTYFIHSSCCWLQMVADLAEQGFGNLKPEARDETRGLPLSDSRYPKGAAIPGDEEMIRYL